MEKPNAGARAAPRKARVARVIRWGLAFAITAGLGSAALRGWIICSDELAQTGSREVVRVCRRPGVTDIDIVLPLLAVVLLLLPDLAEVGLPGGFTLKRTVEQQGAQLDAQAQRQDALERSVQLVQLTQRTSAVARSGDTIFILPNDVQAALSGLGQKERRFEEDAEYMVPESPRPPPVVSRARAQLEAELLRLAAELERDIELAEAPSEAEAADRSSLLRWRTLFAEEMDVVRAVRNSVAHARPLRDEDLEAAAELARTLVSLARQAGFTAS